MTGYPPQSGTPADQAEVERLRAELRRALDVQIRLNIQRGEARAEVERLRGLLEDLCNVALVQAKPTAKQFVLSIIEDYRAEAGLPPTAAAYLREAGLAE